MFFKKVPRQKPSRCSHPRHPKCQPSLPSRSSHPSPPRKKSNLGNSSNSNRPSPPSYLKDRKQFVACNESSELKAIKYGVPEESVFGPSLFSIHYDGVQSAVESSSCALFADDTEIHCSDTSVQEACNGINTDLINISRWLTENSNSHPSHPSHP